MIDALRARNLGCYGYDRNTSPNIDTLSKQGTRFTNAFSTNNSTNKSLMAMLSGRHIPLDKEKNILVTKSELNSFSNSGGKFLSERLKEHGYKTYWLNDLYGWQKRGFDFYFSNNKKNQPISLFQNIKDSSRLRSVTRTFFHYMPKKMSDNIKLKYGRNNGEMATEKAIQIIKEEKDPFFLWIYYNSPHIPYNPKQFTNKFVAPKTKNYFFKELKKHKIKKEMVGFFKGAFSKYATFEDIIARYDSAIYHDDYLIGQVIEALKEKGIFDNTYIFLFSDHGESFDTQNVFFSHHGLYDVCTNFPLIVTGPTIPKNKINESFVKHEDMVPTILDLLKIRYSSLEFDGNNLLSKEKLSYTTAEEAGYQNKRSIRTKDFKYIEPVSKEDVVCELCNEIHGGKLELYDLKKDPEEKNNIASEDTSTLTEMKTLLEKHLKEEKQINERRRIAHKLKNSN